MYSLPKLVICYVDYFITAKNLHGLHSPFVYNLAKDVIYNKGHYYAYEEIEQLRNQLLNSTKSIQVKDFGAGSRVNNNTEKKISQIAKNAAKPAKYAQLIFRLCDFFQPKVALELGTSLGITSAYIAKANENTILHTFEGCPETSKVAALNFNLLNATNVKQHVGNFDDTLPPFLSNVSTIDFAFLDGNHRYQPTIDYFNQLVPYFSSGSCVVLDDIHWSKEMERAWDYVKNHDAVTLTIDLFFVGLVFFDTSRPKEHIKIRF